MSKPEKLEGHEKTVAELEKHVGGKWHWNADTKTKGFYILDTTPALGHVFTRALGQSGYAHELIPESEGALQLPAMSKGQAESAIALAHMNGYGQDNHQSFLAAAMEKSCGKSWQKEGDATHWTEQETIHKKLQSLTYITWHKTEDGLGYTSEPLSASHAERIDGYLHGAALRSEPFTVEVNGKKVERCTLSIENDNAKALLAELSAKHSQDQATNALAQKLTDLTQAKVKNLEKKTKALEEVKWTPTTDGYFVTLYKLKSKADQVVLKRLSDDIFMDGQHAYISAQDAQRLVGNEGISRSQTVTTASR
jgi:hypothetical protein